MRRFYSTVVRSSVTLAEQTDAVNYYTIMQDFERSGKLPKAPGLPLGSFESDSAAGLDLDAALSQFESGLQQADKLDRRIKLIKELTIRELQELESKNANTPLHPDLPVSSDSPVSSESLD